MEDAEQIEQRAARPGRADGAGFLVQRGQAVQVSGGPCRQRGVVRGGRARRR
jgi:hypothetical protein